MCVRTVAHVDMLLTWILLHWIAFEKHSFALLYQIYDRFSASSAGVSKYAMFVHGGSGLGMRCVMFRRGLEIDDVRISWIIAQQPGPVQIQGNLKI